MRYWGYLVAKLLGAGLILYGMAAVLLNAWPQPARIRGFDIQPFWHNLEFTILVMLCILAASGVLGMIVRDHRYRCRACFRRLRMPLATGSWTQVLLSRPRTEYICPFGHGTLKVEELQITGHTGPDWQPHADMWKELAKK